MIVRAFTQRRTMRHKVCRRDHRQRRRPRAFRDSRQKSKRRPSQHIRSRRHQVRRTPTRGNHHRRHHRQHRHRTRVRSNLPRRSSSSQQYTRAHRCATRPTTMPLAPTTVRRHLFPPPRIQYPVVMSLSCSRTSNALPRPRTYAMRRKFPCKARLSHITKGHRHSREIHPRTQYSPSRRHK